MISASFPKCIGAGLEEALLQVLKSSLCVVDLASAFTVFGPGLLCVMKRNRHISEHQTWQAKAQRYLGTFTVGGKEVGNWWEKQPEVSGRTLLFETSVIGGFPV